MPILDKLIGLTPSLLAGGHRTVEIAEDLAGAEYDGVKSDALGEVNFALIGTRLINMVVNRPRASREEMRAFRASEKLGLSINDYNQAARSGGLDGDRFTEYHRRASLVYRAAEVGSYNSASYQNWFDLKAHLDEVPTPEGYADLPSIDTLPNIAVAVGNAADGLVRSGVMRHPGLADTFGTIIANYAGKSPMRIARYSHATTAYNMIYLSNAMVGAHPETAEVVGAASLEDYDDINERVCVNNTTRAIEQVFQMSAQLAHWAGEPEFSEELSAAQDCTHQLAMFGSPHLRTTDMDYHK